MPDDRSRAATAAGAARVTIRRAWPVDVDRIAEIERASFSDPWQRRSFDSLLVEPRVYFAVATTPGGDVAGYVVAWFAADEGEIGNLAVAGAYRGAGVGRRLLDAAVAAATAHGARSVYLEVRDSNAAARALYASRGFEEIGRRRRYYKKPVEDALVLRLSLG